MAMQPTRMPWEDYRVTSSPADGPWRDYQAAAPVQPEAPSFLRTVDDTVRQLGKGASLGFADEMAAGARAVVGGLAGQPGTISERYDANLAGERARDKEFQDRNPITSVALQAAGSMANPLTRFSAMGTLPLQMLRNAGIGAGLGGVVGFGEGEGGVMNRLLSGTTGAATGAAVGAAIPALATGIAKSARTVGGWMGLNNAKTDAQRQLIRALSADQAAGGDDIAGLAARLNAAAPDQPVILPDVTMPGGQTEGLAQAVSREPGIGRATAAAAVAERGGLNQSARLAGAVRNAISADDFTSAKDDLLKTRATAAAPKYEAAFTRITPTADEASRVERFIKDPIGQEALQKGLRIIELEHLAAGTKFDPKAYAVAKAPDGKFILEPEKVPTLRLLDAVKRGYDEIVEGFRNDYGVLQLDQYGRAVNNARAVYRNELTDMYPRYGSALKAWSGPSEALDAMALGRRVLTGDADTTAQVIAKMSPSEKDMFRIGVSRALIDRVKGGGDTADLTKLKSIWGSENVRERVAAAFDDPKAFDEFSDFMKREMDMARVNNAINPRANSATAAIQAQREQPTPAGPMLSAMVSALRGDTVGAGTNVLRAASDALAPGVTLRADQLAPMLFSMRAGDRSRVINELMRRQTTDEARGALARALGAGVTGAGTMTGVQLQD